MADSRMIQVISLMMTAYERQPNPSRIAIYVSTLSKAGYTAEMVEAAVQNLLLEVKYCPSIHEISDEIQRIGTPPENKMLAWDEAWAIINREMHRTGIWGKPNFEKPEVEQAVRNFGWGELCTVSEKELPIVRAQLKNMYEGICKRKAVDRRNHLVLKGGNPLIETAIKKITKEVQTW